jgi:predicted nucleic acid-binding protein
LTAAGRDVTVTVERTIFRHPELSWSSPLKPMTGMANRLRRHPGEVQKLNAYRVALDQICQSRMQVLDVPPATLQSAAAVCQQTGLLINDALIVAMMQRHGLTRLASHDADFDRVPGLTRFAPA